MSFDYDAWLQSQYGRSQGEDEESVRKADWDPDEEAEYRAGFRAAQEDF